MQSDHQPPLFTPDFIQIPYQLISDRELEQLDRMLYGLIYWYEHLKDGECRASNHSFAALLFTTTRVIQNSLNKLQKRGYITRDYKDAAHRNRLRIHGNIAFKHLSPTGDRAKASVPQVTRERPIGDRRERPIGDQSKNRLEKNINTAAKTAAAPLKKKYQDTTPMDLKQFVAWMHLSPQHEHLRVLAEWAEAEEPAYTTKGQWNAFMARNMRAASRLAGHDNAQLQAAYDKLRRDLKRRDTNTGKWVGFITKYTLETLEKYV